MANSQPPASNSTKMAVPGPVQLPSMEASRPYIITLNPQLTSTLGEQKEVYSRRLAEKARALALITNLFTVRVRFSTNDKTYWSDQPEPILSQAGRPQTVPQYRDLFAPVPLDEADLIKGLFVNDEIGSPDGAGQVGVWCELLDPTPQPINATYPRPYALSVNVDANNTEDSTISLDKGFIIMGAMLTGSAGSVTVEISDSTTRARWSDGPIPIGFIAGFRSLSVPVMKWPRPFFLPRRTQLDCRFFNVAVPLRVTFVGYLEQ
jgi:hypothetical protein